MTNITHILITVGDNDFYLTCTSLLETIRRAIKTQDSRINHNYIREFIKEGLEFHYKLFQVGHTDINNRTIKYLKDNLKVFTNETALTLYLQLKNDFSSNGEWYLLNIEDDYITSV